MVYDLTMLKTFYAAYSEKIERVRNVLRRPMTLAEKILYAHLYDGDKVKNYRRGEDYVNFRPDRVAMQDATAQMALLQFMNAGREQVAVPSTRKCVVLQYHLVNNTCSRLPKTYAIAGRNITEKILRPHH